MTTLHQFIQKFCKGAETILLLSDMDLPVLSDQNHTRLSGKKLSQLSKQRQFDLVLINHLLENLSHEEGEQLIAHVRDIYARQILLIISADSEWKSEDFIGLGFRKITDIDQHTIWYFAVENYKRTPDWLNSRYWANPEMFGKYRW